MPPWWKIRRELVRPFWQLRGLAGSIATYYLGAWYFDTFLSDRVQRTKGAGARTSKAAVYVLYAPNGLFESHLVSINYLVKSGYGVITVSNAALSKESRKKLAPLCIEVIERPNFGYDFGAYRQGVLALEDRLTGLDSLLLINDSTWFPILDHDWIQQAEGLAKDFVGAASNYGIPRSVPESIQDFSFNYHCSHKNFHYCSFALLIRRSILNDPEFLLFWKHFPLTNIKNRTVRRGEIGLSKWVLKKGYSHCETLDVPKLANLLQKLDYNELSAILQHMIIPEKRFLKRIRDDAIKLNASLTEPEAQDLLRKLILVVVARIGISYALPYFNIFLRNSMFLKKSPLWLDEESRARTLAFIESLEIDSNKDVILREARLMGERLA
jgi:lipopolysaccharide biosynthesis protein